MKSPFRYINSLSFNSTQGIYTLSNTQSLKNVFLSGRAFPYRPSQVVSPGFKTTFPYFKVTNSPNQVSLTRSVSFKLINSLSFNSTQGISTLSNTQSLKNVFLSGRAFPYRPSQVVSPGFKTTFPYFKVTNSPNQVSLTRSVSFKL